MKPLKINQQQIIAIASAILIVMTISVGATVFFVMKIYAENLHRTNLQSILHNNVLIIQSEVRHAFAKTATVATRPFLIKQIMKIDTGLSNAQTKIAIQQGARSFLSTGLSAIAMYDRQGLEIAHAGDFIKKPLLEVSINSAGKSRLLYSRGDYFLYTEMNIEKDGQMIGKIITESPLNGLKTMFTDAHQLGSTADLALCTQNYRKMILCFPTTLLPNDVSLKRYSSENTPLPMSKALSGATGFIVATDYRHHEVVAAYSPVGNLGLGMVLKIDSAELYASVWQNLRSLVPLMLLIIIIALFALKWLLSPLVLKLVRSEEEARRSNERLRISEKHVRLLLESADEGIISINSEGIIELFNPAAERMFLYSGKDVLGKNISILMPEPYASKHDHYIQRYLQTNAPNVIGMAREQQGLRRNGEVFPIEIRISEFKLQGQRKFIGIVHDITERKAYEEKISHLAHYDALTDLPNRLLIRDRITQTIARARRTKTQFAVMFIDLNRFKDVNDTLGHEAGDILLKTVAQRLTKTLRAEDTVGRQSGDEFIVVLSDISDPDDPAKGAQKIIMALSQPVEIHGQFLQPSASIGIAVYPMDAMDVETLIQHSDKAMYQAKKAGGGAYRFFTNPKRQPQLEE